MEIQVNGEEREIPGGCSLRQLVDTLKLAAEQIAIELNGRVVRRSDWPGIPLADGDKVEIVYFVGGGMTGGSRQRESL